MNTTVGTHTSTKKLPFAATGVKSSAFSQLKHIPEDSAVSIINELYRLISFARKNVENTIPFDDDFSPSEKEILSAILDNIQLNTPQDKYRLDKLTQELNDTFDQIIGLGAENPGQYEDRPEGLSGLQTGTVKFFNQTKGFGFIKPDDSNEDVFVHASGLIDQIRENDKVKFNVERGKKGLNAVNVDIA